MLVASKAELQSMPAGRPVVAGWQHGSGRLTCVPWTEMTGEIAAWDRLAETAAEPNPFFESWCLLPALKALDSKGKVRLLRYELEGKLLGLMPVQHESGYYRYPLPHWRNWVHANAFLGSPLVAAGHEAPFWQALLAWADERSTSQLFLHLTGFPMDGALFHALRKVATAQTRPAAVVEHHERAMLCSSLSPDAYFEHALTGKRRSELRRREKRLSELGYLDFQRFTGAEHIETWIDEFLKLENTGWKGAASSALTCTEATEALFREAMYGAAERGKLERLALRLDGKAIAFVSSFVTPPGVFGYKTAYDENFARYSPGVILQRKFLDVLDREDIAWCDSCSAPNQQMIDHFWRERRVIARINVGIGGKLRQLAFRQMLRAEGGETLDRG